MDQVNQTENKNYIGITIGPIFETIKEAISPASMWFASAFFSEVTRLLCEKIKEKDPNAIISPHSSELSGLSDGIGKYPDRIFLCSSTICKDKLDFYIKKVKEEAAGFFEKIHSGSTKTSTETFINDYLQINYIILKEEDIGSNILFTLNRYLDYLELMPTFPSTNENNSFRDLFLGEDEHRNKKVKESSLIEEVSSDSNQLFKDIERKQLRSLEDIALGNREKSGKKTDNYFAVIYADGDRVGTLLEEISEKSSNQIDSIRHFSEACLTYTKEAAKKVGDAKGMTIYAGGDDVLCLSPIEYLANGDTKTVFDLCKALSSEFEKKVTANSKLTNFIDSDQPPSLSFGVSIQYEKYPLYEAFDNANYLLFEKAKKTDHKNCIAVNVIKSSGQRLGLWISNTCLNQVLPLLCDRAQTSQTLHSIIYKLEEQKALFETLEKHVVNKDEYIERFVQLFDNIHQQKFEVYIRQIAEFYYYHIRPAQPQIGLLEGQSTEKVTILQQFLRIKKFFIEEGGK
jgi:CRISPR-associated protein Cmr2